MSDRAEQMMQKIWDERNSHADTEEKLVSSILKNLSSFVINYNSQNGIIVLDSNDILKLSEELDNLKDE